MMKYWLMLALLLMPSMSEAEESQAIALMDGINEITVTIENGWNRDISNVTAEIFQELLPSWLSADIADRPVLLDMEYNGKSTISLLLSVSGAPADASADIPVDLRDDEGHHWVLNIKVSAEETIETAPDTFDALYENFPNPFNPETTITYSLKTESPVELTVYNTLGQVVRTLVNTSQAAGVHEVTWDSRDDRGRTVASGLYFYRIHTNSFTKTLRMMLVE